MFWRYTSGILILLSLYAGVWSTELPDLSKINVNDLQSQLPAELSNSNITLDDAKTMLRRKCIETAGGNEEEGLKAYAEIEAGSAGLMECITGIVNYTAIQIEIEQAKPNGELDAVFHKYCAKRPEALSCVEDFNKKLVPCLDADEQDNKEVFMRIVRSLLNFVCHKGGDQIALFIAEEGPECLSSKKSEIEQCLNDTLSSYLPKDGGLEQFKTQKLPKFVMGQKQCAQLANMETCIVKHLEKCKDITPANIVESMFRFVRNETICRNTPEMTLAEHVKSASPDLKMSGCNMWLCCIMLLTLSLLQLLGQKA